MLFALSQKKVAMPVKWLKLLTEPEENGNMQNRIIY